MTDYYTPWQPTIGDRVRVRLSPECRQIRWRFRDGTTGGHWPAEDGRTGTVCAWPDTFGPVINGHGACIDFDRPFEIQDGTIIDGAVYAPAELEPLAESEET